MKKIVSLILTMLLCAALCVPAFADVTSENVLGEAAPTEVTPNDFGNITITEPGNYIISDNLEIGALWILSNEATLTIAEGKTVTVSSTFNTIGIINLFGTLDVRSCGEVTGIDMVMISETGTFLAGDLSDDGGADEDGTVTLHFDGNYSNASNVPEDITAKKGESVVIPDVKPLRANYVFQGWSESSNATTTNYKPGNTIKAEASVTLYAVWASSSGNGKWLYYNENSDGDTVQNMPIARRASSSSYRCAVTKAEPVREGYKFTGWNTKADGKGNLFTAGQYIGITGNDVTLYAQWEKADVNTGSTLSDGNVLIVIAIAAAVIFGFSGYFLGKKKRVA